MGKYGFRSGYGKFQNIQAGTASITTTTQSINFPEKMRSTPSVIVSALSAKDVNLSNITNTGFEVTSTATGFNMSWIAFDDEE